MPIDLLSALTTQQPKISADELSPLSSSLEGLPAFQDQQKNIDRFKDLLALRAQQELPSTPSTLGQSLAALANFERGGALKLPDVKEERDVGAELLAGQANLAKLQGDYLNSILSGLKSISAGKSGAVSGTTAFTQRNKAESDFQDKLRKTQVNFLQKSDTLDQLQKAIDNRSYGQIRALLGQAARAISGEKGVLTDKDVTRILPSTIGGDIARFKTWVLSKSEEPIDEGTIASIEQLVQSGRRSFTKNTLANFNNDISAFKQRSIVKGDPLINPDRLASPYADTLNEKAKATSAGYINYIKRLKQGTKEQKLKVKELAKDLSEDELEFLMAKEQQ